MCESAVVIATWVVRMNSYRAVNAQSVRWVRLVNQSVVSLSVMAAENAQSSPSVVLTWMRGRPTLSGSIVMWSKLRR